MTITVGAAIVAPILFVAFVASLLTAILFRPYPSCVTATVFFIANCVNLWGMRNGIRQWRAESRAARGLCPACGYPSVGNAANICPECGRDIGRS